MRLIPRFINPRNLIITAGHQSLYYTSKSEVSEKKFSLYNIYIYIYMQFPKVILERASYPPVTHRKMKKFKTNKMSRKGKQGGVDIRCETTN